MVINEKDGIWKKAVVACSVVLTLSMDCQQPVRHSELTRVYWDIAYCFKDARVTCTTQYAMSPCTVIVLPVPGGGWEFFSSPLRPERLWGPTQPPIKWVPGALSLGIKRQGREANHSSPSNAEVEK
jgi:hypothetical protein